MTQCGWRTVDSEVLLCAFWWSWPLSGIGGMHVNAPSRTRTRTIRKSAAPLGSSWAGPSAHGAPSRTVTPSRCQWCRGDASGMSYLRSRNALRCHWGEGSSVLISRSSPVSESCRHSSATCGYTCDRLAASVDKLYEA